MLADVSKCGIENVNNKVELLCCKVDKWCIKSERNCREMRGIVIYEYLRNDKTRQKKEVVVRVFIRKIVSEEQSI